MYEYPPAQSVSVPTVLVSISVGVIAIIVVIIVIKGFTKSLWWGMGHYYANWLFVRSGLYHFWLALPDKIRVKNIIASWDKKIQAMKRHERKKFRKEEREKLKRLREKQNKA